MTHPLYSINSPITYVPGKPLRDQAYLRFVRKLGFCIACGATRGIEAAHTGCHGIGQKSGDDTAINLCAACHRTGPQALHKLGPVKFAEVHQLDVPGHICEIRSFYLTKIARVA